MEWLSPVSLRLFSELHDRYGAERAFGRILSLVEAAGCETVAIEDEVEEGEYSSEYDVFYSKVFEVNGHSKPTRLHFFQGAIKSAEEVVDNDKRYLGYCDVRPTSRRSISTALIDSRVFVEKDSKYLYLICQRKFDVKFTANRTLQISAFPYIQQDGAVIRCAQAALASMSFFFGKSLFGPDFTKTAATIPSQARPIPSGGLIPQAIGLCFNKMDREPVFYDFTIPNRPQHPEQIIYRYLESGIPVLLGIQAGEESHAVAVIGHTFTPDSWMAQTSTLYYSQAKTGAYHHCSTNWVERFVVQDDNLGPYTLAPASFAANAVCQIVMVPLEPNVHFMAEEAESFVSELFSPLRYDFKRELTRIFDDSGKTWPEENRYWFNKFCEHAGRCELVLRTNLRSTSSWREQAKDFIEDEELLRTVQELPMPEKIWVVEISWPQLFVHGRRLCGEVLLDPTTLLSPRVNIFEQAWFWIRVPGLTVFRNARTKKLGVVPTKEQDIPKKHHRTVKHV